MDIKAAWEKIYHVLYLRYNNITREKFGKRETYEDELNFHMIRFFFLMFVGLFIWLFYIPSDLEMHQFPRFAVTLRLLLSLVSLSMLCLSFTKIAINSPSLLAKINLSYLLIAGAVIAGTSGYYIVSYSGETIILILLVVTIPLTLRYKVCLALAAYAVFSFLGFFFYDGTESLVYAFRNVGVATLAMIFLSWVYNNNRLDSWLLHKKLSTEMQKNEKSLITISGLAQKAEEASRAKSSFLAKMSHEIRTPMNAVAGAAEIALRENPPENIKEQILTIKHSSASLLSIINDILDFSKIESGKMEIVEMEYSFASLISDVVSIIKVRMFDSRVLLVVELDANIPCRINGDEIRIRQVLLNILSNAVKYTEKGSITFKTTFEKTNGEFFLLFSVEDTGRGLREEDLNELFDDFTQFDLMDNRNIEGTGLGLAITKNLVDAMDGTINASSTFGKGSIFTVRIPQKIIEENCFASVTKPEEKGTLIFISQEEYQNSIARSLTGLGVEAYIAHTKDDLHKKLESGNYSYLIVENDSYKKAETLLGGNINKDIKIIVVSSFVNSNFENAYCNLIHPVHTLSLSNVLNGKLEKEDARLFSNSISFKAPEANVLIVDDIETNRFVANGLLKPYEMRTVLCSSGRAAIEAVARAEFDLILMDHMMPQMDGIETTKHIRDFPGYEHVPIIVLTANAISGIEDLFLASGFDDCLFKPIDTSKLNHILEKWLPESKQVWSIDMNKGEEVYAKTKTEFVLDDLNFDLGQVEAYSKIDNNRRLFAIFVRDAQEKLADLKLSLRADSLGDFVIHAHALRGASANIGAKYLTMFAADLENAGKRNDKMYVLNKVGRLVQRFELLIMNLNKVLEQPGDADTDKEELRAALANLSSAIDAIDVDEIDRLGKIIGPYVDDVETGGDIERLLAFILSGDYEDAQEIIRRYV